MSFSWLEEDESDNSCKRLQKVVNLTFFFFPFRYYILLVMFLLEESANSLLLVGIIGIYMLKSAKLSNLLDKRAVKFVIVDS